MHEIALDLLILLSGIWLVAVTLRPLGLPTVMGELIVGVLVGPAVFGLIEPNEAIQLLAEIGIFFLMFHAGVETQPSEFFVALKRSIGVAIVGALVPFGVSFAVATAFGLDRLGATFVGLTMTATAVVITLKSLKDLGLANTRVARIVIASCVIDDLLTLLFFGLIIGVLTTGAFDPLNVAFSLAKVVAFFGISFLFARYIYPRLSLPFRSRGGKGFTFVLLTAFAAGLFAEAIGLHMILGAYLAGLFFEEKVAHPNLIRVVHDRAYGIAYSFLGPIFFISLGFSITFDISATGIAFLVLLTLGVIIGQIVSAGGMALRIGLPAREALTVGVGMCGRAELAFILAALALSQGAIDQTVFSVLIFTAFVLNLFTPLGLKGCAVLLEGRAVRSEGATRGVLQIDKFTEPLATDDADGELPRTLPDVEDGVVVYGYGPEVDFLLGELAGRGLQTTVVEEDEEVARRLHERGQRVVHASLADGEIDLALMARARALVANSTDDADALLAMGLREHGFSGPLIALVDNPTRRGPMTLAGATAAFTPNHVLAAALASRASPRISPRVAGVPAWLGRHLEVAELRIHDRSPFAYKTLSEAAIRAKTGAHIVGQWRDDRLRGAPDQDQPLEPGTILVAVGSSDSIRRLSDLARPITREGRLVVIGSSDVAQKLVEILGDAGEEVCVVAAEEVPGVDIVGDVLDPAVLGQAAITDARAVILALEPDSATLFAATVVRDTAPDVPVIASLTQFENVKRAQRAGVDFALSVSQVAGQILIHHILDESVSLQPRIMLVRTGADALVGQDLQTARVRDRTGCSIVVVERDESLLMDFPKTFKIEAGDRLYVCGANDAISRFRDVFPSNQ